MPKNTELPFGRRTFLFLLFRHSAGALGLFALAAAAALLRAAFAPALSAYLAGLPAAERGTIAAAAAAAETGLFLLALLAACIAFLLAFLKYRTSRFSFEEFDLKVRTEILRREVLSFPYRQMQNVDIERGIIYRLCGVSKLVILTAGHDDPSRSDRSEAVLDPVDAPLAEKIREELLERIGVVVVSPEEAAASGKTPA